ncbi:ABC transporter substrate-binding protein [Bacillus sp. FJAT-28004]|uniref:ABC transporter substrate-binding protein n=1 Tax=Bacillus sp. FJAT-28004 TaxID=1679165 RepID=UPI0006B65E55|nr:extracellular solute-binding protein [Bacillus sp. FJAT-28004]
MKKWISILMSLVFAVSLTACSGSETKNSNHVNNVIPVNTNRPIEEHSSIADDNKDDKKTIVVSVLGLNDFYKEAKQKYEAQHPNITIQFNEFATSGGVMSSADVEKYIKTTTTEILSGKGADLFSLDTVVLPIDRYVSKKAFINLDEFIKKDTNFDQSLYHMNILENSKMNDGLYVLPISFYLQMLFGDADGIANAGVNIDDKNWTWSQFADIGKQLAATGDTNYSLGMLSPENMLNSLISDNYAQLMYGEKKKANFESAFFIDLLKQVNSLYNDKILSAESVPSHFILSEIYSPQDYLARLGLYYTNTKVYQKPHAAEQKSGVAFGGIKNIALNSNSEIKGTAWDFIKFLMSEEMQNTSQQNEFSINKSVNEKMFKSIMIEAKNGMINVPKGGNVKVSEQDLQAIKTMITEASLPITLMNKVQSIIAEEAKAYFTGQKTAEAVAELIQNRVTTYINE